MVDDGDSRFQIAMSRVTRLSRLGPAKLCYKPAPPAIKPRGVILLPESAYAKPENDSDERYEHADAVIDATGAEFRFGGNQAFYAVADDYVQMPHCDQFGTPEAFY